MGNINGKKVLQVVRTVEAGGKQLYQHNIYARSSDGICSFCTTIINSDNTQIDLSTLIYFLVANGFKFNTSWSNTKYYQCVGINNNAPFFGVGSNSGEDAIIIGYGVNSNVNISNVTDTVIAL